MPCTLYQVLKPNKHDNILFLEKMALHETTYEKHQVPTEEYCYFIMFQVYFNIIKVRQS